MGFWNWGFGIEVKCEDGVLVVMDWAMREREKRGFNLEREWLRAIISISLVLQMGDPIIQRKGLGLAEEQLRIWSWC